MNYTAVKVSKISVQTYFSFQRYFLLLYVVVLTLPIFLNFSSGTINLGHILSFDEGYRLHAGESTVIHAGTVLTVFLSLLLIFRTIFVGKIVRSTEQFFVIALLYFFTLSFLLGLYIKPDKLNFIYFAQTILPILGFFIGTYYPLTEVDYNKIMFAIVISSASFILLLYGAIMAFFGFEPFISGNLVKLVRTINIPQFMRYYPVIIAISLSIALGLYWGSHEPGKRFLLICIIFIYLLFLPLTWSRSGLLMYLIVISVHAFLQFKDTVFKKNYLNKIKTFIFITLMLCASAVFMSRGSIILERVESYKLGSDNNSEADSRRLMVAKTAVKYIILNPVSGRMMIPEWEERIGGQEIALKRLLDPHNQYLDYGLRGGIFALIFFTLIIFKSLGRGFAALKKERKDLLKRSLGCSWVAILSAVLIGNFFQLNFTQAYTGTLLWFLVGFFYRMNTRIKQT